MHFRGFEIGIVSPVSGYSQLTYNQVNNTSDDDLFCETVYLNTEEIRYLQLYSDSNDVEGMIWTGHLGTVWEFVGDGNDKLPAEQMGGRPIGFKIYMGKSAY